MYIRKSEKVDEWLESVHILPHSNRRATVGCVVWTVVVMTSVEAGGGGGRWRPARGLAAQCSEDGAALTIATSMQQPAARPD